MRWHSFFRQIDNAFNDNDNHNHNTKVIVRIKKVVKYRSFNDLVMNVDLSKVNTSINSSTTAIDHYSKYYKNLCGVFCSIHFCLS